MNLSLFHVCIKEGSGDVFSDPAIDAVVALVREGLSTSVELLVSVVLVVEVENLVRKGSRIRIDF